MEEEQTQMDVLFDEIDAAWFAARAPAPSEIIPCEGHCGRTAWVPLGQRPALCYYYQQKKGASDDA